jgi:hypothetical protein
LLARGYTPVRFKAFANDTSVVAMAAPDLPEQKPKRSRRR